MGDRLWGIDLGGTKVEGVVLDQALNPIIRERIPTESGQGYEHIIRRISELVDILSSKSGVKPQCIGIGTPGISDPKTGLMKNCNATALIGKHFLKDLSDTFKIPVYMANDANCFALAESRFGAGRGASSLFGVIMGSGVGGALVINGEIVAGANGICGEWGHNVLFDDGPRCYCGKNGCVEKFISGPALEEWYAGCSGVRRPLKEIMNRASLGSDEAARAVLNRLVSLFGRALSVVINIVDPAIVVLGGGLSNIDALYTRGYEELCRHIFHDCPQTVVVKNELGDSAGVFGAALLCERGNSGR